MKEGATPSSSGRERRKRVRRVRKVKPQRSLGGVVSWVAVGLGAVLAAVSTYLFIVYPGSPGPGAGKDVELVLDRAADRAAVARLLAERGAVRNARLFTIYAHLVNAHFAHGPHLLTDDASPGEIVRRLEREGAATRAKVVIPEGWTRFDIGRRLHALGVCAREGFLAATTDTTLLRELAIDGDSAEGFLFPATYELARDSDPREVVRRLVAEFEKRFAQLDQSHRLGRSQLEAERNWGRREIVTLASMVEREAAVDEERPIVASVFLNRLRDPSFKRKVLQSDPTSGYGCLVLGEKLPACAGFTGKITHAINVDPGNPYSTYVHEGLPPGPIANPGARSLEAVLAPASTKYLYFVAREGRRHTFSASLEEHDTAVKDLRERRGRDKPL